MATLGRAAAPRRNWSALPGDALAAVALRLRILSGFLAFGSVCQLWREAAKFTLRKLLATLPPFLFWDARTRGLLCPTDGRFYTSVELPRRGLHHGRVMGSSHGHLILLAPQRRLWVFNPFTGAELRDLPCNPPYVVRAVLSSPPTSPDFALVIFNCDAVWYARLGFTAWRKLYQGRGPVGNLEDVAFLGGRGYVLYACGVLATFEFDLDGPRNVTELECGATPMEEWNMLADKSHGEMALTGFKGELFAFRRGCYGPMGFLIFQFDADRLMWRKLESIGARVLFLGHEGAPGLGVLVDNYASWGGHEDTVYYLQEHKPAVYYRGQRTGLGTMTVNRFRMDRRLGEFVCHHDCQGDYPSAFRGIWVTPSF